MVRLKYDILQQKTKSMKRTKLVNTYDKNFDKLKQIHEVCNDEDYNFKKSLHDREMKVANIQKAKIKEKHKYSDALQDTSKSIIIIV